MNTHDAVLKAINEKIGKREAEFLSPPPVFLTMKGEFISFDADAGILRARFPVLGEYLNPYGSMQGGMIAAAVDNTIGPLSFLVAAPNVTRRLEMKYTQPVTPDRAYIIVEARLLEQKERQLFFSAAVREIAGQILARAKALHWILDE
ncbi:MAG: PaaI family thioesterase [Anaerolineales bacterium]|nr:PaaI family thioesterase [Anaerolineales bacterium]